MADGPVPLSCTRVAPVSLANNALCPYDSLNEVDMVEEVFPYLCFPLPCAYVCARLSLSRAHIHTFVSLHTPHTTRHIPRTTNLQHTVTQVSPDQNAANRFRAPAELPQLQQCRSHRGSIFQPLNSNGSWGSRGTCYPASNARQPRKRLVA